jgi:hypothetical protein
MIMKRRVDSKKLALWSERFNRFRESGLSITRFCANEGVSVSSFSYWTKRLEAKAHVATLDHVAVSDSKRLLSDATLRERGFEAMPSFSIRIHDSIQISVPVDCLEAIRCVMQSIQVLQASALTDRFHRVVVGS